MPQSLSWGLSRGSGTGLSAVKYQDRFFLLSAEYVEEEPSYLRDLASMLLGLVELGKIPEERRPLGKR